MCCPNQKLGHVVVPQSGTSSCPPVQCVAGKRDACPCWTDHAGVVESRSKFTICSSGRDEAVRVLPLLCKCLREGGNTGKYTSNHKDQRDDGPDDAPALRRPSIALGKLGCIGTIDLSENQIVANIPRAVQGRHHTDEKLCGQTSQQLTLPRAN